MSDEPEDQTTMNTLTEILAEITARAEKATPGKWWSDVGDESGQMYVNAPAMCEGEPTECVVCRVSWPHQKEKPDADFIAAARTDVPVLVNALKLAIEQRNYHMDNMRLGKEFQTKDDAELTRILEGKE